MSYYDSMPPSVKMEFAFKMLPFKSSMDVKVWDSWVAKMKEAQTEDELLDVIKSLPEVPL